MQRLHPDQVTPLGYLAKLFITMSYNTCLVPKYRMGSVCWISKSIDQNCQILQLHARASWNEKYLKAGTFICTSQNNQNRNILWMCVVHVCEHILFQRKDGGWKKHTATQTPAPLWQVDIDQVLTAARNFHLSEARLSALCQTDFRRKLPTGHLQFGILLSLPPALASPSADIDRSQCVVNQSSEWILERRQLMTLT